MSNKWCNKTNEDWSPLQHSVCCIFGELGELKSDTEEWFKKSRECGCDTCIEYIGYLQKRLGPLVETIGTYHKELTEVIGYVKD